jgi:hypothetical protein
MDLRALAAMAQLVREYNVARTTQPPAIDGNDDDAAWQSAGALLIGHQPDSKQLAGTLRGNAKLLWDNEHLYFTARVRDDDVRNTHTANDDTLWEGDNVELFVRMPGQEGAYYELQIAPTGARFDAKFTAPRTPKWQEAARFDSGMQHAVSVDGTLNADGADRGFAVEAKIPWKNLGLEAAPAEGTVIEANIYRIDDKGTHDLTHMGTWVPVGGDFHKLDGAGKFKLVAGKAPVGLVRPLAAPAGK